MLRGSDLPAMMTRVEAALTQAARNGSGGAIFMAPNGEGEAGVGRLRRAAEIDLSFPSGSDRFVFGPVIRVMKKGLRRGLRWYVDPMMEQQIRFNHAALDLVEKLRLQNERLLLEIESLRREVNPADGADGADGAAGPAGAVG